MINTKSEQRSHAWFALADTDSCRLLFVGTTQKGSQRVHVGEFGAMVSSLPEQEHARPMTNAGATHSVENNEQRFAAEVINWLETKSVQHKVDHLVILAPPRMLGVLRQVPLGTLKGRVEELRGDLMRLNTGQLAKHSIIREILPPHPSDRKAALEPTSASRPAIRPC